MNTIDNDETYTLGDKVDYTGYKTDSDFIEWNKELYKESYRRKNPITDEVNTFESLKELVTQREKAATRYAEKAFNETSDYVKWQEWKHYLEKVNA